jgi:hypothetical protein
LLSAATLPGTPVVVGVVVSALVVLVVAGRVVVVGAWVVVVVAGAVVVVAGAVLVVVGAAVVVVDPPVVVVVEPPVVVVVVTSGSVVREGAGAVLVVVGRCVVVLAAVVVVLSDGSVAVPFSEPVLEHPAARARVATPAAASAMRVTARRPARDRRGLDSGDATGSPRDLTPHQTPRRCGLACGPTTAPP